MVRTVDAGIQALWNGSGYTACHLIVLGGGTFRMTDYSAPLIDGGFTYVTDYPFSLGEVVADDKSQAAMEVTFHDVDGAIKGLLWSEDAALTTVKIYEAWVNTSTTPHSVAGKIMLMDGRTNGGRIDVSNDTVTLPILPYRFDLDSMALEPFTPTCRYVHRYKGVQCGYVGGITTCDGTYGGANGCYAHGAAQALRFGGFRFAPTAGNLAFGTGTTVVAPRVFGDD